MIDILIPVYYRPHQIARLYENITNSTKEPHQICFIIESKDIKTLNECLKLGNKVRVIQGNFDSYCNAMNTGYFLTQNEFVFTGVDDLEMTFDWDVAVMQELYQGDVHVVGSKCIGADLPPEGHCGSYFTIRRSWVEKHSLVSGMPNLLFYPYYHHEADRELMYRAKDYGVYRPCPESIIKHCQVFDEVQKKTVSKDLIDRDTYWNRRHLFRGA